MEQAGDASGHLKTVRDHELRLAGHVNADGFQHHPVRGAAGWLSSLISGVDDVGIETHEHCSELMFEAYRGAGGVVESVGGLWNPGHVRARRDDGVELNAEFAVEVEGAGSDFSVVLESAGGRTKDGGGARNADYVPLLRLLLGRLRDRNAVVRSAQVVSSRVLDLPESDRMVLPGPVDLARVGDVEALRRQITSGQGRVALPAVAAKPGNNRKRLQLRVSVPGYGPGDASRLGEELAGGNNDVELLVGLPAAGELLRDLIGIEIHTVSRRRPNIILSVDDQTAIVSTERSPEGTSVSVADVQRALDLLASRREVRVRVHELGHRSSFIGAVLATLPGVEAEAESDPAWVRLHTATADEVAADPDFGALDVVAQVTVRKEQAYLRKKLMGKATAATCAICGDEWPAEFLVAAHIKKRAVCTEAERRDFRHVAMLACSFGCDALYESGWITIAQDGRVQTARLDKLEPGTFGDRLRSLDGRPCSAHSAGSEPYFAWHRSSVFRGVVETTSAQLRAEQ